MSDLNKNRGQSGGALAGDSVLMTLSDTLRNLMGYSTGNSGISSLTSLGFSFDSKGILSFDPAAFASATAGQTAELNAFLGASSSGGFLKIATDALGGIEDPVNGILTQDLKTLSTQITAKNNAIGAQQDRIERLQTTLTQQMAAADAAIAALEQQQIYMQNYFDAMQTAARGNG
jgi:flagellar hook-associated protein 2